VLDELRIYISLPSSSGSHFTPFTHIKQFWLVAGTAARNERSRVQLAWSPCKTKFEYSRPGIVAAPIAISDLRKLVHENQQNLVLTLESLLPSTILISTLESFPWASLKDDGTSDASFLDDSKYWSDWVKTAVTSVVHAYLDPTETNHRLLVNGQPTISAMKRLLKKDLLFQQFLVLEMITNTGISPRAAAMREFRYRTDGMEKRNLHLFNGNTVLCGGRQKGESRRDGHRDFIVRAFCPKVGRLLLLYLSLIRRAIIEILKEYQWYTDIIPTLSTYLLVDLAQPDGRWEVAAITRTWQDVSQPFLQAKLSVVDMRQIGTGIFYELFPDLIRLPPSALNTAVDGLGDHGRTTSDHHYGRNSEACGGISLPDIRDYILASNVQQALMHVLPVDPSWPGHIRQSPGFDCDRFLKMAFEYTQYAIPNHYQFKKLRRGEIQDLVRTLCQDITTLFSGTVCHCQKQDYTDLICMQNQFMQVRNEKLLAVLFEVTSIVAWGISGKQQLSELPFGTDDLVRAACIVSLSRIVSYKLICPRCLECSICGLMARISDQLTPPIKL
jgi:hypothetical protein